MPAPDFFRIHKDKWSLDSSLDLTIVIPCLNEEARIVPTLEAVTGAMRPLTISYEVLVIDDGSQDRTADVVENYQKAHPDLPVRLHRNPHNLGLSRSYIDGAFMGRGKYYRMVSGDNPEPAAALGAVFTKLGAADMIIPYHAHVTGKPRMRLFLSGLYTRLVNYLSGYHIRYYNGGALHARYNVMRWGPYSFGFGFQAELITRLLDEGASYIEVPLDVTHVEKSGGNSAINFGNFLSVGHTLLEIFIRRIRKRIFQKM